LYAATLSKEVGHQDMYAAASPEELGPASSRAEEEGIWRRRELRRIRRRSVGPGDGQRRVQRLPEGGSVAVKS
jgi:hypothetical protein